MSALSQIHRLIRSNQGISAIEFALVLPVMLIAWLGMTQLFQFNQAVARITIAAQSISNLAGDTYATTTFADLMSAANQVLAPLPTAKTMTMTMTVDVVDVAFDDNGNPTQSWRCTSGSNAPAVDLGLVSGLASANQSVVMVTVVYNYIPAIAGGVIGNMTITERSFNQLRSGDSLLKPC